MLARRSFLSILILLAPLTLFFAATCSAQEPNSSLLKIAEGAYGRYSSFNLWINPEDHQLRANVEMHAAADNVLDRAKPVAQTEIVEMNPDFTMRHLRYESKNFKGLPDGALDCTVKPKSLDCVSTFVGQSGKGSINARGSYATQFGAEVALLDLPWFYTTLVACSDRDPKQPHTLGIVTIAFDGDKPQTLITGQPSDADVKYLGTETMTVLGHAVKAHKFDVSARHYAATVWVSERGLLLAATWGGDQQIKLTSFRQRINVIPEFPVESQDPVRH